jgi:hypothetical protein
MLGSYTYYPLQTDTGTTPDGNTGYKQYEDYYTFGQIAKFMLTEIQILEAFAGYDKKNYYNQLITSSDSMRDTEGFRVYVSWAYFYLNNGFINLRYDVSREVVNRSYCNNTANRFSVHAINSRIYCAGLFSPVTIHGC